MYKGTIISLLVKTIIFVCIKTFFRILNLSKALAKNPVKMLV